MGNLEIRQDALLQAYPRFEEAKEFYLERIEQVKAGFHHTYGKENPRIFSAPGRTEIGGNHTDHQHGCVLAASVNLKTMAVVTLNDEGIIRVQSETNA